MDATDDTRTRWVMLAVFLLVAFAAGGVGSLLQGEAVETRYLAFERPAWAPPSWAFGVVWPVLYLGIGIAGWRVWRAAGGPDGGLRVARVALGLWAGQLVLNALWPWVFFGLEAFGPAIAVIVALDLVVLLTIRAAADHDRVAAWLLVPYLAWILYATALNIALWWMN